MELKEYQIKALSEVKEYLDLLSEWKKKAVDNPDFEIDFPEKAWEKAQIKRPYHSRKNGLGEPLPNFCLKIPTGGGKTLLAVKAIDLINTSYRKKRTGLILWIVPTNQIYNQTIKCLSDRAHPYRQHLDIASGGKTLISEKTDRFAPNDIKENLVVLMLMLPSASRKTKETLRIFKDNGGFQSFFPSEDDRAGHENLLRQVKNLDTFSDENGFWGKQIKTSLGNALRLLSPVIILDEGHKAYSEIAQETLRGFNPSIILELSATPSKESNILVNIFGSELNREEMIKLDLHIINKANPDWKNTLLSSIEKRNFLEKLAVNYEAKTEIYIRPICLIQVERTGKDQRMSKFIHSEDVREYLIKTAGILPEQVAVTSAELKEIKGIDLLSKECPIRYIITKQALQEGWDCPFAYILTTLTNPASKNALTQLVGRILRQPNAKKTKIKELDESYVFTFQQKTVNLLANIRKGFEGEGLGDLASRIITDEDIEKENISGKEKIFKIRDKFKSAVREVVLPVFVIKSNGMLRRVNYDMDIASRIEWNKANLDPIFSLELSMEDEKNVEVAVSLSEDKNEIIKTKEFEKLKDGGLELDSAFLARHLIDIVPNPWVAHRLGEQAISRLLKKYDKAMVINNFVFIIEELRKHLAKEKDRMSKEIFQQLLNDEILRFVVIGKDFGFQFPKKLVVAPNSRSLSRADGQMLQKSLFDFMEDDNFNETEKAVAWYLEDQNRLFFWYRNIARHDYAIQGWRKQKIYPDFIFTRSDENKNNKSDKVFVVETKGIHLAKNDDTEYKESMLNICNKYAKKKNIDELELALKNKDIKFEVVFEDEWKRKVNELLNAG
ncbi:MAG: DEAD/DEAH box helicase family protein [bacterium]